jgi:HK97 gp10 family phage protein
MVDNVEFNIEGLDAISEKLKAVSGSVKQKRGRAALRKAGMVVVKAAAAAAEQYDDPETARSISKNVAIQWNNRRFRSTGDLAFRIGVRGGAVIPKGKAIPDGVKAATPHWRFIEFGTKTSIARPFLRPALANNIDAVTQTFVVELEKAIDRAIRTGKTE